MFNKDQVSMLMKILEAADVEEFREYLMMGNIIPKEHGVMIAALDNERLLEFMAHAKEKRFWERHASEILYTNRPGPARGFLIFGYNIPMIKLTSIHSGFNLLRIRSIS